ncbi:hypothetical protein Leryth_006254 [Lithospermum erythrorhizon]|nr:hypothetical protein Leryth_006254 [Lithospermum erythrorhizon]
MKLAFFGFKRGRHDVVFNLTLSIQDLYIWIQLVGFGSLNEKLIFVLIDFHESCVRILSLASRLSVCRPSTTPYY